MSSEEATVAVIDALGGGVEAGCYEPAKPVGAALCRVF